MPFPNYLCVFIANQEVHDDVVDIGRDPDFGPPIPTWGICRPPTRHSVGVGSYIVFLGYYKKDQRYLVKGWMRVGEKISYLDALKRFGNRPNIIIREGPQTKSSAPKLWTPKHRDKDNNLQELARSRYGTDRPQFLTTIHFNGRVYVQFEDDPHEVDNWKCKRMFLCRKTPKRDPLKDCIMTGVCQRETEFLRLKDYIVAAEDCWQDVGQERLNWTSVAPPSLQGQSLRTGNWHKPLPLSDAQVKEIRDALHSVCT